jgi:adenylate cyclase
VLSHVILEHGGTTLRYTGDEVYAVFGAPTPLDSHEVAAVNAAQAMQAARLELGARLEAAGIPSIAYGIGVHSGDLVSTIIGSDVRAQYAVVGNAVNLGARLCGEARAGEIVISNATFSALDRTEIWEAHTATLKGISGPLVVYRFQAPSSGDAVVAEPKA